MKRFNVFAAPLLLAGCFLAPMLASGCSSDDAGDGVVSQDVTGPEVPDVATAKDVQPDETPGEDIPETIGEDGPGPSADVDTVMAEDWGPDEVTPEDAGPDESAGVCADETETCDAMVPPAGSCVDSFECVPEFLDADGTHCMPVFKANGSACLGTLGDKEVQVVAASGPATLEAASVCDRFVCYAEAEAPPECVLGSTLPELTQVALEADGFPAKHACGLGDIPADVSSECNDWFCRCATGECLDAECQAIPDGEMLGQACDAADACWTATCYALPDSPYSCVQEAVSCPPVSDAWCVVMPPCDAAGDGCPDAMDEALSSAKCADGDPCVLSAVCDPDNPEADGSTGCVIAYDDPENGCADAIVGISAGGAHTLATQSDGTLHWWGVKTYAEPPEGVLFKQAAGGKSHSCGIDTENNLHCWGLSDGGVWDFGQVTLTPTEGKFTFAAAGYNHSCAIRENATAHCWGIGSEDNLTEDQVAYEKGQVKLTPSDVHFQQIGAGHSHSCGLKVDGSLACWGGTSGSSDVPTGGGFVSLAVGFHHNCALDTGWTKFGLVEDVPEGAFQSVSCGYGHTCAVRTTGEVVCWGVPNKSEGAPNVVDSGQATDAPLEADFRLVGVNSSHSCAVTADEKVTCWGSDGASKSTPPVELQP
jgi:hypothetical protein